MGIIENVIINSDCLGTEGMKTIPTGTVKLVICDLPFEQTNNAWDKIIPFEPMWKEIDRVTTADAAVLLMGMQPFTTRLNASNLNDYRYEIVWKTKEKRNFLNASRMPLRQHINISVFYKQLPTYNPQKTYGHKPVNSYKKHTSDGSNYGKTKIGTSGGGQTDRYPTTILDIPYKTITGTERIHPTQKPVEVIEWLIRTYSNPGDLILDFVAGGCTTAVAALNTGRKFICIEQDEEIYRKAYQRVYGNYQLKMSI